MLKRHACLALALAPFTSLPLAQAAPEAPATVVVQSATQNGRMSLDAVVEAVRQTTVSSQVPGAVVALHVKAGDRVRAGQELLRLDARAAQQGTVASEAQVRAAQAAQAVASKEYERQQQLFQKHYISQAALDRAQAQAQAAQAQVAAAQAQAEAARTQSGFFSFKAPYDAVVADVPVTLGDMAMPGRPLVQLHDPSALRVTVAVPQSALATAASRDQIRLELPGLNPPQDKTDAERLITPAAVQLLPMADPATHTVSMRLALPAGLPGVQPGMFARVWLPAAASNAGSGRVFVPASAVVRRAELTAVYVLDAKNQPVLRQVRLGQGQGAQVEVLSGLNQGERVVSAPQSLNLSR